MAINNLQLLAILLTSHIMMILVLVTASSEAGAITINDQQEIRFLGTADGKSYFAQMNRTMIWEDAKTYCNSFNMTLATIQTQNQFQLLLKTFTQFKYQTYFWLSARESRKVDMLAWDETNVQVKSSVIGNLYSYGNWSDYSYCTIVHLYAASDIDIGLVNCDKSYRPLCECNPGK